MASETEAGAVVYLVWDDSYSDIDPIAAFSTREKADAFVAYRKSARQAKDSASKAREARVDAVPLDRQPERLGHFGAVIDDAGTVLETYWLDEPDGSAPPAPSVLRGVYARPRTFNGYGRTVEDARLSAEELRRQTLARGEPARG